MLKQFVPIMGCCFPQLKLCLGSQAITSFSQNESDRLALTHPDCCLLNLPSRPFHFLDHIAPGLAGHPLHPEKKTEKKKEEEETGIKVDAVSRHA